MPNTLLQRLREKSSKQLAILIDPDALKLKHLDRLLELSTRMAVDYLFLGGSLLLDDQMAFCLDRIRERSSIPVILFPGSPLQIHKKADALLFLSLISGRNPELLIGQHVIAAPYLKKSGLEIISTAYLLIDGGRPTTATYVSHTNPIPADKPDIAAATAMAGEMLGLSLVYLDAGSGALKPVSTEMIEAVREAVEAPIIVGGGINSPQKLEANFAAGANVQVVGNSLEKDPMLLEEMMEVVKSLTG